MDDKFHIEIELTDLSSMDKFSFDFINEKDALKYAQKLMELDPDGEVLNNIKTYRIVAADEKSEQREYLSVVERTFHAIDDEPPF